MLTQAQISERVNYLGASEAAAVLGLSRWGTPLSVWAEKTGQIEPDDISENLAVELGNELEDFVARKFEKKTGKKVERVPETIYHPLYPFLGANLDRRVVGENAILEAKTCSAWKAREWDQEEMPIEYIVQVMHQLAVSGAEKGYLAVLIGNQDFKIKEIFRDDKALEDLVRREVSFWCDFVVPKVMPAAKWGDKDTLTAMFPEATEGEVKELTDEAAAICEVLEGISADLKSLERQEEEQKNQLRALMGEAETGLVFPWKIQWANVKTRRLDTEALKKGAPDVFEKFRKMTTTRKFLISKTSEKGGNENGEHERR